jgi:ABC-2 type transport system ATP-binding protein
VAVLWTTHLLDEIEPSDDVVILHQGKRMAAGLVSDVVAQNGSGGLRGAFTALTGSREMMA